MPTLDVPAPADWGGGVRCHTCGDNYGCGDCGFEIDAEGTCLRPKGHTP